MRILPPRTLPPEEPIRRRHCPAPLERGWAAYRDCLRWDFGFTCAFCLLHDNDLYGGLPGEGLGGSTVEHRAARSADPSSESAYENCFYACRLCNRARSFLPISTAEARLLDPTSDRWGTHFNLAGDQLSPAEGDPDAAYTHRAYQLDDPRKVIRRRARRTWIETQLQHLNDLTGEIAKLLPLADSALRRDLDEFAEVLLTIRAVRADVRRALGALAIYRAIPADAPSDCRCSPPQDYSLPEWLELQTFTLPDDVV